MKSFDQLIRSLHNGAGTLSDVETSNAIFIDANRQFILPKDFNKTIAYTGDVNSQIILFDCPLYHEGHVLSECEYKKIGWSNLESKVEGTSKLTQVEGAPEGRQLLSWTVPPEAFISSGKLQISISIYDLDENNYTAFSWNTSSFSELFISNALSNVGIGQPARDEVLSIDEDTRRIVSPSGYNTTIANYGDIGTTRVFFRGKRFIRGIDLLDAGTVRMVRWRLKDQIQSTTENIFIRPYTAEVAEHVENREGVVDIIWVVPPEITCNNQIYAGNFDIELSFTSSDGKRTWRTSTFSSLSIGKSLFMMSPSPMPEVEGYYVIDGNKVNGTGINTEVAGIYTLRSYTTGEEIILKQNELAIEYDKNGSYMGLKVGANGAGENASTATYADKLMQGETIILDGGSARVIEKMR